MSNVLVSVLSWIAQRLGYRLVPGPEETPLSSLFQLAGGFERLSDATLKVAVMAQLRASRSILTSGRIADRLQVPVARVLKVLGQLQEEGNVERSAIGWFECEPHPKHHACVSSGCSCA